MTPAVIPAEVFTLWLVLVGLALLVFVPLAVYSLFTLWRAAQSIRRYAHDGVAPAQAIASHTAALPALDQTISVATEILAAAEAVAGKLATIADVLEQRAARRG